MGIGALLGGVLLSFWKLRVLKVYIVSMAHIIIGIAFFSVGWLSSEQLVFFAVLTSFGGVSASFYNSGFTATIQEAAKPELLGRVFSMCFSLDVLPTILLALIGTGFLVEIIGINVVFTVLGGIVFLVGITSLLHLLLENWGNCGCLAL